jgi:hypothetical protein
MRRSHKAGAQGSTLLSASASRHISDHIAAGKVPYISGILRASLFAAAHWTSRYPNTVVESFADQTYIQTNKVTRDSGVMTSTPS